jgi:hypothetical protein
MPVDIGCLIRSGRRGSRIVTRRGACGIRRAAGTAKRIILRIVRWKLFCFYAPFQGLHHLNCHFDSRAGSGWNSGTWSFPQILEFTWTAPVFRGPFNASLRIICPQFSYNTLLKDTCWKKSYKSISHSKQYFSNCTEQLLISNYFGLPHFEDFDKQTPFYHNL